MSTTTALAKFDAPAGGTGARYRLDRGGRRRVALMALIVAALLAMGFALLAIEAPAHVRITGENDAGAAVSSFFGWGTGLLALTLGMRHAFDMDHIAAIDNTTRKLSAEGKRPLAVGFSFSLGHSSVVFLMTAALGFGINLIVRQVTDANGSLLQTITGIIGPSVSGVFLIVIAIINVLVLASIVRMFRRTRAGEFDESQFEAELARRGFLNRIFGRAARRIDASWKMYPIGFLFGLGFDTATEITLLVTVGAAASHLAWWAVLSLPLLFAGGMCLFDTLDGVLMNYAYGWAFMQPVRKVYYNVVVTVLSVFLAVVIGAIELIQVFQSNFGWRGRFFDFLGTITPDWIGYAIVGLLVATWVIAVVVWKAGRFETRLGAGIRSPMGPTSV